MAAVNSKSCRYCYIDIDINNHRSKLAMTAAFVDATDSRYGFSSKDLRQLGGSQLSRIHELMSNDHEWSCKILPDQANVTTGFPPHGSRIVFKLYWDIAPLACENFATLCTNGGPLPGSSDDNGDKKSKPAPTGESGKRLTYRHSAIHRVVKGFIFQGGDFVFGNGSGGESVFNGKKFKDERAGLALRHDRAGLLSMGNSGKNSNTSQFFVTLGEAPQCDGKHVVFGEVVSGMDVAAAIESFATPSGGEPSVPINITHCGVFSPLVTPGDGCWYDRPDPESYTGITPEFMIRPRVGVLAPNDQVGERFRKALGEHASTTVILAADSFDVLTPLEKFVLDLILIAPACAKYMDSMDIPPVWFDAAKKLNGTAATALPRKENVFIVAKPLEALSAVATKSWVGIRQGWLLSASFA